MLTNFNAVLFSMSELLGETPNVEPPTQEEVYCGRVEISKVAIFQKQKLPISRIVKSFEHLHKLRG